MITAIFDIDVSANQSSIYSKGTGFQ